MPLIQEIRVKQKQNGALTDDKLDLVPANTILFSSSNLLLQ